MFVVVFIVEGWVRPGYSPLRHPVSSLALGDFGWVQTLNFLLTGVLMFAFAVGARPALRPYGAGIWAPLSIGAYAVGLFGAGLFATDPVGGYPPGAGTTGRYTTHGALHDAFSLVVFVALPVACLVLAYRFATSRHWGWAGYSLATAVEIVVGFVLFAAGFAGDPTFAPVGGLLQRLTIVAGWGWLMLLSLYLLRRLPPARRGTVGR